MVPFAEEQESEDEIERQNKITKQILQRYLEKRLYPALKRPPTKVPTISEILPRPKPEPFRDILHEELGEDANVTRREQETLQSVESELIFDKMQFYEDVGFQGMSLVTSISSSL